MKPEPAASSTCFVVTFDAHDVPVRAVRVGREHVAASVHVAAVHRFDRVRHEQLRGVGRREVEAGEPKTVGTHRGGHVLELLGQHLDLRCAHQVVEGFRHTIDRERALPGKDPTGRETGSQSKRIFSSSLPEICLFSFFSRTMAQSFANFKGR